LADAGLARRRFKYYRMLKLIKSFLTFRSIDSL